MRQRLGQKKTKKLSDILSSYFGEPVTVISAYTRGGWEHGVFQAFVSESMCFMVDTKTGAIEAPYAPQNYKDYPSWLARFPKIESITPKPTPLIKAKDFVSEMPNRSVLLDTFSR
jgi:hypothetical protein